MSAMLAEALSEEPIAVLIVAKDPISRAGVQRQLLGLAEITVLPPSGGRHPDVALVVADAVDEEVLGWIRTIRHRSPSRIVLVAGVTGQAVVRATDAGANGVVPRSMADQRRLVWAIQRVHRGEAIALFSEIRPEPASPVAARPTAEVTMKPVSERDREVLRLLADGCDTGEIARTLAYSEPTIKNVIQRLFEQLKAKNRPHAVALALRSGII